MKTQITSSLRVLLVTIALAFASAVGFAATDVSADVLIPREEVGAAGGGGGFLAEDEEEPRPQAGRIGVTAV